MAQYKNNLKSTDISLDSFRSRHPLFIRVICLTLLCVFVSYDVTWAQGIDITTQAVHFNTRGPAVSIPDALGSAEPSVNPGSEDLVINIQDAHASLSAQDSILNILDHLTTNFDVRVIGLEGSSGPVDVSFFRTIPSEKAKEEAGKKLVSEGLMSGAELFAILSKEPVKLYGIENDPLYRENLSSFNEIVTNCVDGGVFASRARAELMDQASEEFPEQFYELYKSSIEHKKGSISFIQYWEQCGQLLSSTGFDTSQQPNVTRLLRSIELEKDIDFDSANIERKDLIEKLTSSLDETALRDFLLQTVRFKKAEITVGAFHSYIVKAAIDSNIEITGYPNLRKYSQYVKEYESIDIIGLFAELDNIEDIAANTFLKTKRSLAIYEGLKYFYCAEKLFNVNLTPAEYKYISSCVENSRHNEYMDMLAGSDPSAFTSEAYREFSDNVDKAMGFYRIAESRNSAMLENTVKAMKANGQKVAAMVTGGFHTGGLTALMRSKGLSYLVIMPRFETGKERPYIAVLTGKRNAFQAKIDSGKYTLAIRALCYTNSPMELIEPAITAYAGMLIDGEAGTAQTIVAEHYIAYKNLYDQLSPLFDNWDGETKRPFSPLAYARTFGLKTSPDGALITDANGRPVIEDPFIQISFLPDRKAVYVEYQSIDGNGMPCTEEKLIIRDQNGALVYIPVSDGARASVTRQRSREENAAVTAKHDGTRYVKESTFLRDSSLLSSITDRTATALSEQARGTITDDDIMETFERYARASGIYLTENDFSDQAAAFVIPEVRRKLAVYTVVEITDDLGTPEIQDRVSIESVRPVTPAENEQTAPTAISREDTGEFNVVSSLPASEEPTVKSGTSHMLKALVAAYDVLLRFYFNVFKRGDTAQGPVIWIYDGKVYVKSSVKKLLPRYAISFIVRSLYHLSGRHVPAIWNVKELEVRKELMTAPFKKRQIVIGDIHGKNLEVLGQLLTASGFLNSMGKVIACNTSLIFMGDMIDKGPRSAEVYDYILALKRKYDGKNGNSVTVLMGNHESMLYRGMGLLTGDASSMFRNASNFQLDNWLLNQALICGGKYCDYFNAFSRGSDIRAELMQDPDIGPLAIKLANDIKDGLISYLYEENGVLFVHGGFKDSNLESLFPDAVTDSVTADSVEDVMNMYGHYFVGYLDGTRERAQIELGHGVMQKALWNKFGEQTTGEGIGFIQVVAHTMLPEVSVSNGNVIGVDILHNKSYGYLEIDRATFRSVQIDIKCDPTAKAIEDLASEISYLYNTLVTDFINETEIAATFNATYDLVGSWDGESYPNEIEDLVKSLENLISRFKNKIPGNIRDEILSTASSIRVKFDNKSNEKIPGAAKTLDADTVEPGDLGAIADLFAEKGYDHRDIMVLIRSVNRPDSKQNSFDKALGDDSDEIFRTVLGQDTIMPRQEMIKVLLKITPGMFPKGNSEPNRSDDFTLSDDDTASGEFPSLMLPIAGIASFKALSQAGPRTIDFAQGDGIYTQLSAYIGPDLHIGEILLTISAVLVTFALCVLIINKAVRAIRGHKTMLVAAAKRSPYVFDSIEAVYAEANQLYRKGMGLYRSREYPIALEFFNSAGAHYWAIYDGDPVNMLSDFATGNTETAEKKRVSVTRNMEFMSDLFDRAVGISAKKGNLTDCLHIISILNKPIKTFSIWLDYDGMINELEQRVRQLIGMDDIEFEVIRAIKDKIDSNNVNGLNDLLHDENEVLRDTVKYFIKHYQPLNPTVEMTMYIKQSRKAMFVSRVTGFFGSIRDHLMPIATFVAKHINSPDKVLMLVIAGMQLAGSNALGYMYAAGTMLFSPSGWIDPEDKLAEAVKEYKLHSEKSRALLNKGEKTYTQAFREEIIPELSSLYSERSKQNEDAFLTVGVTGSAASGKTTIINTLYNGLLSSGTFPVVRIIYFDDWLLQKSDREIDPRTGKTTEDVLKKFDVRNFVNSIKAFIKGSDLIKPIYDADAKGQVKIGLDTSGGVIIYNGESRTAEIIRSEDGLSIKYTDGKAAPVIGKSCSMVNIPVTIVEGNDPYGRIVVDIKGTRHVIDPFKDGKRPVYILDSHGNRAPPMLSPSNGEIINESSAILDITGHTDRNGIHVSKPWGAKEFVPRTNGVFIVEGILSLYDFPGTIQGDRLTDLYTSTVFVDCDFDVRLERGILRENKRSILSKGRPSTRDEMLNYTKVFNERKELEDTVIYPTKRAARYKVTTQTRLESLYSLYKKGELILPDNLPILETIGVSKDGHTSPYFLEYNLDKISEGYIQSKLHELSGKTIEISKTGEFFHVSKIGEGLVLKTPVSDEEFDDFEAFYQRLVVPTGGGVIAPGCIQDVSDLHINLNVGGQLKRLRSILVQTEVTPFEERLETLLAEGETGKATRLIDQFFAVQAKMWSVGLIDENPTADRYGVIIEDGRERIVMFAVNSLTNNPSKFSRKIYRDAIDSFPETLRDYVSKKISNPSVIPSMLVFRSSFFEKNFVRSRNLASIYNPFIISRQLDYLAGVMLKLKAMHLYDIFRKNNLDKTSLHPALLWTRLWAETISIEDSGASNFLSQLIKLFDTDFSKLKSIAGMNNRHFQLAAFISQQIPPMSDQSKRELDEFIGYFLRIFDDAENAGHGTVSSHSFMMLGMLSGAATIHGTEAARHASGSYLLSSSSHILVYIGIMLIAVVAMAYTMPDGDHNSNGDEDKNLVPFSLADSFSEVPAGWLSRLWNTLYYSFAGSVFPRDHAETVAMAISNTAHTDTEAFNVWETDDNSLIITTRKRGSDLRERIQGIVDAACEDSGTTGVISPIYTHEQSVTDSSSRRITVSVFCYKMPDEKTMETAQRYLRSDLNYRGRSSIPNWTTSGVFSKLVNNNDIGYVPNPNDIVSCPEGVNDKDNAIGRMNSAYARMMWEVQQMGANASFAMPGFELLESVISDFDKIGPMTGVDNFKTIAALLRNKLKKLTMNIARLNDEISQEKERKGLSDEEAAVSSLKISYLQRNKNNEEIAYAKIAEFWYYVMNPAGDYMHDSLNVETAGPSDASTPIVLFVEKLTPGELDYLLRTRNVKAIVTTNAGITSHWVVAAKNRGIPVAIVEKNDFVNKKYEHGIYADKPQLFYRLVILRSDASANVELVLGPRIPTIRCFQKTLIKEIAFEDYVDAEMRASVESGNTHPSKNVPVGDLKEFINLLVNADTPQDISEARNTMYAGDVGLVRTEFLFSQEGGAAEVRANAIRDYLRYFFKPNTNRLHKISRENLINALKNDFMAISRSAGDDTVRIRTIDFQDDKETLIHEYIKSNKDFLGQLMSLCESSGLPRRIGTGVDFYRNPLGAEILTIQLEALMEAYLEGAKNIKILFPMISTPADVNHIISSQFSPLATAKMNVMQTHPGSGDSPGLSREVLDRIPIGIMVETDTADENIAYLASVPEVNFYSFGTNDLARYIMAKVKAMEGKVKLSGPVEPLDRDDPTNAIYLSTIQPAVLQAVVRALASIHAHNLTLPEGKRKEVSICGEMASWYDFAAVLVRKINQLNISTDITPISLSMSPTRLSGMNIFLRHIRMQHFDGVPTLLEHGFDSFGIVPVDQKAQEVVSRVFTDIFHGTENHGATLNHFYTGTTSFLDSCTEADLKKPDERNRTLFTLELILRSNGSVETPPSARTMADFSEGKRGMTDDDQKAITGIKDDLASRLSLSNQTVAQDIKAKRTFRIISDQNMHARPAAKMANFALQFGVEITLKAIQPLGDETPTVIDRPVPLLAAGSFFMDFFLLRGSLFELEAKGARAEEYLDRLSDMENGIKDVYNDDSVRPFMEPVDQSLTPGSLELLGKALGIKNYTPYTKAPIIEELIKTGVPVTVLIALIKYTPLPVYLSITIAAILMVLAGRLFTVLHLLNKREPPISDSTGLMHYIKGAYKFKRILPANILKRELTIPFFAELGGYASFGLWAVAQTILHEFPRYAPEFLMTAGDKGWLNPLAPVIAAITIHIILNVFTAVMRAYGVYYGFATIEAAVTGQEEFLSIDIESLSPGARVRYFNEFISRYKCIESAAEEPLDFMDCKPYILYIKKHLDSLSLKELVKLEGSILKFHQTYEIDEDWGDQGSADILSPMFSIVTQAMSSKIRKFKGEFPDKSRLDIIRSTRESDAQTRREILLKDVEPILHIDEHSDMDGLVNGTPVSKDPSYKMGRGISRYEKYLDIGNIVESICAHIDLLVSGSELKRGDTFCLADIGCGKGIFLSEIAENNVINSKLQEHGLKLKLYGIGLLRRAEWTAAEERIAAMGHECEFVNGFAEFMPSSWKNKIHMALSVQTIRYSKDPLLFMEQAHDILAAGGKAVIHNGLPFMWEIPNIDILFSQMEVLGGHNLLHKPMTMEIKRGRNEPDLLFPYTLQKGHRYEPVISYPEILIEQRQSFPAGWASMTVLDKINYLLRFYYLRNKDAIKEILPLFLHMAENDRDVAVRAVAKDMYRKRRLFAGIKPTKTKSTETDMGSYKLLQMTVTADSREGLSNRFLNCLDQIDTELSSRGLTSLSILKQEVFVTAGDNDQFERIRAELSQAFDTEYGKDRYPRPCFIAEKTDNFDQVSVECSIIVPKSSAVKIIHKKLVSEFKGKTYANDYTVVEDGSFKSIYASGLTVSLDVYDISDQSYGAFVQLENILSAEGMEFSDITRQWNYIENIVDYDLDGGIKRQRYQIFNDIRNDYYAKSDFTKHGYPAATGIGMQSGGIVIEFIASVPVSEDARIVPVKNPLQISAHSYSKSVLETGMSQDNRKTPKFERAKAVVRNGSTTVYVSGTAAIRGEENTGGNAREQTDITLKTIEYLISVENLASHDVHVNTSSLSNITQARVYVKFEKDITAVREACESILPAGTPVQYVVADVCRPGLLVEIEAVASFETGQNIKTPVSRDSSIDILFGIPSSVDRKGKIARILRKAASKRLMENIKVVVFDDSGNETDNADRLSGIASEYNARLAVPVSREITCDSLQEQIDNGFLAKLSGDLFTLAYPALATTGMTAKRLESMTREELASTAEILSSVISPAFSFDLSTLSAYRLSIYNSRITSLAGKVMNNNFAGTVSEILKNDNSGKVAAFRVSNLGELKFLAETHRKRTAYAKKMYGTANTLNIKVTVDFQNDDEYNKAAMDKSGLLEKMGITDVIKPSDISFHQGTTSFDSIEEEMLTVYSSDNVIIAGYKTPGELVWNGKTTLMEYENIFTSDVYDTAIRLLSHGAEIVVEGDNLTQKKGNWFTYLPRINRADIDLLKREIAHYRRILIAA